MNREQVKALLPIIKAYSEGQIIEIKLKDGTWSEIAREPKFDSNPQDYRIKPSPKFRPFKDQDECIHEMLKHQPVGWLHFMDESEDEYGSTFIHISEVKCASFFFGQECISFQDALRDYTFYDGKPVGIKEED